MSATKNIAASAQHQSAGGEINQEDGPPGSGGWKAHAENMERERDHWRQRAQTMFEHQRGEAWYWQGDGNDHPESMVNSLPVVIRADQLRALIAGGWQTLSAAPAIGDELRDTLVAVSAAIADQDDRAAQAMLREILKAPRAECQPAPALLSDEELCQIEEPYLLNFRIPLGGQYDFARAVEKAVICKMGKAQAPQGETNVQLDTDPNTAAPGQHRNMACSLALGQPVGNWSDQVAGHPSAQGDKLLTVAERNIRSFLRSATFKSESDREAALDCVDVLWEAARAADSVPAVDYPPLPTRRRTFLCYKCGGRECEPGTIGESHPPCKCGYLGFAEDLDFTEDQMRDFADRTHALRTEQAPTLRRVERTTFPNSPAHRALHAFVSAMHDNHIKGDDMRAAMLWFLGYEECDVTLQQAAPKAAPVVWLSSKQLRGVTALHGQYLPFRRQPEGRFDTPVYLAEAAPKAAPGEQNTVPAELLEQAHREGWAACRDAETIGEEAEDWAFGNSTANSRMIDAQQAAPQQEAQEPATVPYQKLTNEIDMILSDPDTELSIGAKRALLWMRTWVSVPLYTAPQPAPAPLSDDVVRDAAFEVVRKKLCTLPRYSFVLDDDGLVRRVQDRTGNWIEFDEAHALFDPVAVDAAIAAQGGKV